MGNENTFGTDSGVASTIALLEAQLPAVRERLRRAEAELAGVTAEQDAIVKALDGLRLLSDTPVDGGDRTEVAELPSAPAVEAEVVTVAEAAVVAEAAEALETPEAAPTVEATEVVASAEAATEPVEPPAAPAAEETATAKTPAAAAGKKPAKKAPAKKAPAKQAAATKKAAAAKKAAPARGTRVPVPAARKAAKKAAVQDAPSGAAAKRVPAVAKPAVAKSTVAKSTVAKPAAKPAVQPEPAGEKPPVKAAVPAQGRRRVADADSVLGVLSRAEGPLRAREVAGLLGLDALEGNVNAIRTRLERLAKDGRAQRPGRGLYTVAAGQPSTAE
ncbi:hypothetical protein ACWGB8_31190 [Kitasatospora sp. NPDC054939]